MLLNLENLTSNVSEIPPETKVTRKEPLTSEGPYSYLEELIVQEMEYYQMGGNRHKGGGGNHGRRTNGGDHRRGGRKIKIPQFKLPKFKKKTEK